MPEAPCDASASSPAFSIVIPVFNDADRLPDTLAALGPCVEDGHQIIFVDDGSTDGSGQLLASFVRSHPYVLLLTNEINRGKGHAVRRGMLAATGRRILMTDSDLSAPLTELPKLAVRLDNGTDIAIGSRDMPDSRLAPPQPFARRIIGWCMKLLRRRLLLPRLADTQCGFKLFTRDAARRAFGRAQIDGYAFDIEVLAMADRLGMRIDEVGIVWRNHPKSHVRPLRDGCRALRDLFAIRRRLCEIDDHRREGDGDKLT